MPDIYDFIKELAPLEIEYVDSDDNYHCLNSYIKRVDENSILIAPPQKNNIAYNLPDGQEVNIIFKTEKGIYSAVVAVMSKQLKNLSGINISFPHKSHFMERREFVRVPLQLKTEVIKILDKSTQNQEVYTVQTRNISGSGLCYISDKPLDNYYDIHARIYLDNEAEPIFTRCDHLYSKKVKINGEKAYLTALSFAGISDDDISKLVKACFKYQIGNKEKFVQ
jgi:c-di-GMP-binding flagellar brake protein YcgR